jgi:hypothetical protein
MSITVTPGSDDVISFPDEDGAMLLLLMNVADEIKENVSSFNTAKEVWHYLVKEYEGVSEVKKQVG